MPRISRRRANSVSASAAPHAVRLELVLRRLLAIEQAKEDLVRFAELVNPTPTDPDDPDKSLYQPERFHRVMAAGLQALERGYMHEGDEPGTCTRLIISLPPRHGKTQLASKSFIPWYVGRHPHGSTIFGTYNDKFSQDIGRAVRDIMQHPAYRQVFPDAVLKEESQAADRLETTSGGVLAFVGRGGTTTGRGGDCFPGDTRVLTTAGECPIESIYTSSTPVYVMAYDTARKTLVPRRVQAVQARTVPGLRRITTAAGRVVSASDNHPFYAGGRWVRADRLAPGDRLVCVMRGRDDQVGPRDQQAREAWAHSFLLFQRLLGAARQRLATWQATLRRVFRAGSESWSVRHPGGAVLFSGVHGGCAPTPACGDPGALSTLCLSAMQHRVCGPDGGGPGEVLQQGVLGARPLYVDVGGRQSEIQEWCDAASTAAAFGQGVSGDAPLGLGARQSCLCGVLAGSQPARPPLGQLADEQCGVELGHVMRGLSSSVAWGVGDETAEDTVALVERVCEETCVYDLQVEGEHNFFANGILVHNCLIVDDPVKDRAEADSPTIRESMWNWFNQIIGTRMMTDQARILLISTRWHEDDIIGRLTDPSNDFYDEHVAKRWKVIELPALAMSDDVLGRKEGEALWPRRFGVSFLKDQRRQDPRGFSALYQGRPSPEHGNFFRTEWLQTYRPNQLPQNLRVYAASDHAVSLVQGRDKTALVLVGVDEQDDIWILPQSVLRQLDSNMAVDTMLGLIREHHPLFWWAERGQVSKSIGPFLRKRMLEESAYCSIIELTPVMDKQTRAQSIQGRMAMRKVHFPEFAPWWHEARDQILKFPHAQHDDFVDALAYIGLGLQQQVPMAPIKRRQVHGPHTFGALLAQRRSAEAQMRQRNTGGW